MTLVAHPLNVSTIRRLALDVKHRAKNARSGQLYDMDITLFWFYFLRSQQ